MRHIDRFARTLAFVLLFLTWTDGGAAEFVAPTTDGWHVWQVQGSADDLDLVNIYVWMRAGTVAKIRVTSDECPVRNRTPLNNLGVIPNAASVAWLLQQVDTGTRISESALAAISAHAGDEAFTALTTLVEDRDRNRTFREQALFWLAQSNSDEAFSYLDRLLSKL
jgi:hypothetical protein